MQKARTRFLRRAALRPGAGARESVARRMGRRDRRRRAHAACATKPGARSLRGRFLRPGWTTSTRVPATARQTEILGSRLVRQHRCQRPADDFRRTMIGLFWHLGQEAYSLGEGAVLGGRLRVPRRRSDAVQRSPLRAGASSTIRSYDDLPLLERGTRRDGNDHWFATTSNSRVHRAGRPAALKSIPRPSRECDACDAEIQLLSAYTRAYGEVLRSLRNQHHTKH